MSSLILLQEMNEKRIAEEETDPKVLAENLKELQTKTIKQNGK